VFCKLTLIARGLLLLLACLYVMCSLVLVVLTAESWGLLIGGVFMDAKTAQVSGCCSTIAAMLLAHDWQCCNSQACAHDGDMTSTSTCT
jgi:hypothetical protein